MTSTTTSSANMDDLLSKMKMEVDQLQHAIPCLSVGKETEKLILESSSSASSAFPPPPPPSECSINIVSSSPVLSSSPSLTTTMKRNLIAYMWSSSHGKKVSMIALLWIILGLTFFSYPPSFLYTLKNKSKPVSNPPQTTRIDKEFNYFRWFVYTSFMTSLFWGFHFVLS